MTLPIISIKDLNEHDAFNANIPLTNAGQISYAALRTLLKVFDSFNGDYVYDIKSMNTLTGAYQHDGEASSPSFKLFAKVRKDNSPTHKKITSENDHFLSAADLYLCKKGTDINNAEAMLDEKNFACIYDLITVDKDRIIQDRDGRSLQYASSSAYRAAASLYAVSCMQRKLAELHVIDMELANNEQYQLLLNMRIVSDALSVVRSMETKNGNDGTRSLPLSFYVYLVRKDLIGSAMNSGDLSEAFFDKIRTYVTALDGGGTVSSSVLAGAENAANSTALYKNQLSILQDILRVQQEQIGVDISTRTTRMQIVMQFSDEALGAASGLLTALEKLVQNVTMNVRL
jgi:hypothetical protein